MTTEYEQLLQQMLDERRAELESLKTERPTKRTEKKTQALLSEMQFIEVELQHYRQALTLFRTKNLPKVGRWGKPETEEGHVEAETH